MRVATRLRCASEIKFSSFSLTKSRDSTGKQIRESMARDIRESPISLPLRDGILEMRGQLVKKNQRRLVADERDPVFLVGRLRHAFVQIDESVRSAKLFGDISPEVLLA